MLESTTLHRVAQTLMLAALVAVVDGAPASAAPPTPRALTHVSLENRGRVAITHASVAGHRYERATGGSGMIVEAIEPTYLAQPDAPLGLPVACPSRGRGHASGPELQPRDAEDGCRTAVFTGTTDIHAIQLVLSLAGDAGAFTLCVSAQATRGPDCQCLGAIAGSDMCRVGPDSAALASVSVAYLGTNCCRAGELRHVFEITRSWYRSGGCGTCCESNLCSLPAKPVSAVAPAQKMHFAAGKGQQARKDGDPSVRADDKPQPGNPLTRIDLRNKHARPNAERKVTTARVSAWDATGVVQIDNQYFVGNSGGSGGSFTQGPCPTDRLPAGKCKGYSDLSCSPSADLCGHAVLGGGNFAELLPNASGDRCRYYNTPNPAPAGVVLLKLTITTELVVPVEGNAQAKTTEWCVTDAGVVAPTGGACAAGTLVLRGMLIEYVYEANANRLKFHVCHDDNTGKIQADSEAWTVDE